MAGAGRLLYVIKLPAGAAFVLAGYRLAEAWVRAGERRGNSQCWIENARTSLRSVEFLSLRFTLKSHRSCVFIGMPCVRFTPAVCRTAPNRTACDTLRFYSARVGIALVRSRMSCGYRACLVHFWLVRFFMAIPTENEGTRGTESAARRGHTFAQTH